MVLSHDRQLLCKPGVIIKDNFLIKFLTRKLSSITQPMKTEGVLTIHIFFSPAQYFGFVSQIKDVV